MTERIGRVCKDWIDLICNRGVRCSHEHPPEIKQPERRLNICRDFQNTTADCKRGASCTRVHLTMREESNFYKTGDMPEHGGEPKLVDGEEGDNKSGTPICQDEVKNGRCSDFRGCRFRHIILPPNLNVNPNNKPPQQSPAMYNQRMRNGYSDDYGQMGSNQIPMGMGRAMGNNRMMAQQNQMAGSMLGSSGSMLGSMRQNQMNMENRWMGNSYEAGMKRPAVMTSTVDEEKWRERIDALRKKIIDLRRANSKLDDDNDAIREKLELTNRKIANYENASLSGSKRPSRDADLYLD